jgi:hypothetical protein
MQMTGLCGEEGESLGYFFLVCRERTADAGPRQTRLVRGVGVRLGRPAQAEGVGRTKFFLLSKLFRSRD